ncbi:hypothetical protein F4808DRAFT_295284 [Astrocystis sublimbata]|nr:hypothetical protein F4808DRAFT_295284 [Astrocystis sublimbata]
MEASDDICRAAEACCRRFEACITDPAMKEYVILIESAQGDFNLWCSAIKAASKGKASLDYRLRNHQDMREVVCGLLDGLITSLEQWAKRAASILGYTEQSEDDIEERSTSPTSSGSPMSWDAISDECSNPNPSEAEDIPHRDPAIAEYIFYVQTTLDQLVRISLAIQKAGDKYRFEKVDAELDEGRFEEFRNHLTSIILKAFPTHNAQDLTAEQNLERVSDFEALTSIQKRLIHLNILRRHRIEFETKSREKGRRPLDSARDGHGFGENHATLESPVTRSPDFNSIQASGASQPSPPIVSKASPTPSIVSKEALTATEIGSGFDVKRFMSTQPPSKTMNLTRVGAAQSYPSRPKCGPDGLLLCPYCDDVLPSSYATNEQSWKAHVVQDLMPYSCFSSECETPNMLYLTTEDLLAHMIEKHSSTCWTCSFCSPGHQVTGSFSTGTEHNFWSAEAWESHVMDVHSGRVKITQLPVFLEMAKRSVLMPMACPLCDFSTNVISYKVDDHILHHLHEFSLRALPENSNPTDAKGSKTSQVSGSLSHIKDLDQEEALPLEYPFSTEWQGSTGGLALYHKLEESMLGSHDAFGDGGELDHGVVQFLKCHLVNAKSHLSTKFRGMEINEDIMISTYEQIHMDLTDSLDRYRESKPCNYGRHDGQGPPFAHELPLLRTRDTPASHEGVREEIEFQLFQQRSVLYLGFDCQPKHQPRVILTGGSEKTVVAAELAHQIHAERPECSIFWVDASNVHSISAAYSRIWKALGEPGGATAIERSTVYFLNWVICNEWLMILDGIDRQTLLSMQLEGWLPSGLGGRILLTATDSCFGLLDQATEIQIPPEEEQVQLDSVPPLRPSKLDDFDVAIICTSQEGYDAMDLLFNRIWNENNREFSFSNEEPEISEYLTAFRAGHLSGFNAILTLGLDVETIAAIIGDYYKKISLTLLVHTCSGMPWNADKSITDIFRGDVVISPASSQHSWDRGDLPPFANETPAHSDIDPLFAFIGSDESWERMQKNTTSFLERLKSKSAISAHLYTYPGMAEDRLYRSRYDHHHHGFPECICRMTGKICAKACSLSCDALECDEHYLIEREKVQREEKPRPLLHIGGIVYTNNLHLSKLLPYEVGKDSFRALACDIEADLGYLPHVSIGGVRDYGDLHNQALWSNYAAATAAAAAKALLEEYSRLSPCMLPSGKGDRLIGRFDILEPIHSKITLGTGEAGSQLYQRAAIVGRPGIGKTRVALEVAHRFRRDDPKHSVFWVSGHDSRRLDDDFRAIGRRLRPHKISEDDLKPGENLTSRVQLELNRTSAGRWLVIIDDVDDSIIDTLGDWLSSDPHGSVLLTSRQFRTASQIGIPMENIIPMSNMRKLEVTEMVRAHLPQDEDAFLPIIVRELLDSKRCSPLEIIEACGFMKR